MQYANTFRQMPRLKIWRMRPVWEEAFSFMQYIFFFLQDKEKGLKNII